MYGGCIAHDKSSGRPAEDVGGVIGAVGLGSMLDVSQLHIQSKNPPVIKTMAFAFLYLMTDTGQPNDGDLGIQ